MTTREDCHACTENQADRVNWGDGPWLDEPNRVEWEHADLPCIAHRGGMGAWCGYVGVPPDHPLHGKDCYDAAANVAVHGGLTYAEGCGGHVCHVPRPGESDDVWWLGFDCDHPGDLAPGMAARMRRFGGEENGDHYWTLEEVRAETSDLAEQLAEMKETP